MDVIKTLRLIMKTNLSVRDGNIIFNQKESALLINDLLNLTKTQIEDTGFGFYLKDNPDIQVCHIGIRMDRHINELSYGTEEEYRNKGYMREALKAALEWLFLKKKISKVYGLICENDRSERILVENGFELIEENGKKKWYILSQERYSKIYESFL